MCPFDLNATRCARLRPPRLGVSDPHDDCGGLCVVSQAGDDETVSIITSGFWIPFARSVVLSVSPRGRTTSNHGRLSKNLPRQPDCVPRVVSTKFHVNSVPPYKAADGRACPPPETQRGCWSAKMQLKEVSAERLWSCLLHKLAECFVKPCPLVTNAWTGYYRVRWIGDFFNHASHRFSRSTFERCQTRQGALVGYSN